MNNIFLALYEATLCCRPRNFLRFSIRYLQDSKSTHCDEAHAIHMLPFLFYNPEEFQNSCCTIYCAYMAGRSMLQPNNGAVEFLDGKGVLEIIQALDLSSLGMQSNVINEVSRMVLL